MRSIAIALVFGDFGIAKSVIAFALFRRDPSVLYDSFR